MQNLLIGGTEMKRVDLWKAKLKAAKAEQRIRIRDLKAAARTAYRIELTIEQLEIKIVTHLAKS
jgi:hypothetical protein